MRHLFNSFFAFILICLIQTSCFNKQVSSDLIIDPNINVDQGIEIVDHYLDSLAQIKKFNGAVLIAKNGKPLLISAKGYMDYTLTDMNSEESVFRLASLSKQFTAAGIMILNESGKLDYDDFVSKYIEGFPYQDVTIRNLLTHTSGISDDYIKLASRFRKTLDGSLSIQKAVELVVKNKPKQKSDTNEVFSYSNTGYVLLAGVIENISGQSFENFLFEELFSPLGMNNCRVWNLLSKDDDFENKTWSFKYEGNKAIELIPNFIDGVAGDGAVFCNITDFLIWDSFWTGNKLITNENLNEAISPHKLINGELSHYGFGWSLKEDKMLHTGSWLGARTFIQRDLDKNTILVILDNSQNRNVGQIVKSLSAFVEHL